MSDKNNENDISSDNEFDTSEDFQPKAKIEENANDEKYLNKNIGSYVPKAAVYSITVLLIGLGFGIGFLVGDLAFSGVLCGLEIMSQLTANPTGLADSGNIIESLKSDLKSCTFRTALTPLPLISGLVLGSFFAYPAYKISKSVSDGKHLRSII
jgi:hypothetical protein